MKRTAMFVMSLATALFAAGCGNSHGDREARRDGQTLAHDAANDLHDAAHDAEHAAHDLSHATNAAAAGAENEVREAAVQLHDYPPPRPEVIEIRPAPPIHPADPAQLRQDVKRDAVNAAGAAAEEEAEKLLKFK